MLVILTEVLAVCLGSSLGMLGAILSDSLENGGKASSTNLVASGYMGKLC